MSIWMDRENAIVNSIMSGDNSCGTLQKLVAAGGKPLEDFLRCGIRATLKVCAEEAAQLRADREAVSRADEQKRQALEYISSHAQSTSPAHIHAYAEKALGRIK